jgi:A/G-specific adenine glycosylase
MIKGHRRPDQENRAKRSTGKALSSADLLVEWYRAEHRKLPWRAEPGNRMDPYQVWLSEIMLQQTTVVTVIPYYQKFLKLWPTVHDLAEAYQDDVLREWAGLGYYARARRLHQCAQAIVNDYNGKFPITIDGLLSLPGVGPYTAAAVASIALGVRVVPVDGNIERVVARLNVLTDPVVKIKSKVKSLARDMLNAAPDVDAGDFAQAMMDLGATVCTPRKPVCPLCPIRQDCLARKGGTPEQYPVMIKAAEKPTRYGNVYLVRNKSGLYQVERRPETGLLAGMMGLPTTEWGDVPVLKHPQMLKANNYKEKGEVRHSFTHFNLILRVFTCAIKPADQPSKFWYSLGDLSKVGLPKVFAKALNVI